MLGRGISSFIAAATVLGSVLVLSPFHVRADKPLGSEYLGNVYADGANAPNGVEVRAEIDGVTYGTGSTIAAGFVTTYAMNVEGDDDTTSEKDGALVGDLIIFWVDNNICDDTSTDWQPFLDILGIKVVNPVLMDLHYATTGQPAPLKINEVMPDPATGNDWIEIFNPTGRPVDLSQYRVEDDEGNTQALGGTLNPDDFLVVDLGGDNLSNTGQDEIKIAWRDTSGAKAGGQWVVVDRMEYGPWGVGPHDTNPGNGQMKNAQLPARDVSLRLVPDGAETNHPDSDYLLSSRPIDTKGYSNTKVQPLIAVVDPPSGLANADFNYTITWTDNDPDSNADIYLCYDSDDTSGGEVLIEYLTNEEDNDGQSGHYLWDTSGVPAGIYFVKAVIDDKETPPMYSYSPGRLAINHPPSVSVIEPDGFGDVADESFMIEWTDRHFEPSASVTLSYDNDTTTGGEIIIGQVTCTSDPIGVPDTYLWTLDSVPEGMYYVKAAIFSGGQLAAVYSPGRVTIIHPPSIKVLEPDGVNDEAHGTFTIRWDDRDADDNASIALYYDSDKNPSNGETKIIDIPWGEDPDGTFDSFVWNTTLVRTGFYYIEAEIDDGKTSNYSYSTAMVHVVPNDKPSIRVVEPSEKREAQETFLITWEDLDLDDNATITLYYVEDTAGAQEILIGVVPQGEDSLNNTFIWIVRNVPEGTYHIKAVIRDPYASNYSISVGVVEVKHPSQPEGTNVSEFPWILAVVIVAALIGFLLVFILLKNRKKNTGENPKGEESQTSEDRQSPE